MSQHTETSRQKTALALASLVFIVAVQIIFSAVALAQQPEDPGGGGEEESGTIDVLFKFLIAVACYFGPYFMIGTIISWAGKAPAALRAAIGSRGKGLAGGVSNWAQGRRQNTAPSLAHKLNTQAARERATSVALNKRYGSNAPSTWRTWAGRQKSPLLNRFGRTEASAASLARRYMGDDESKQLQNFNAQHMQALAMANGDANQATAILQADGVNTNAPGNTLDDIQQTARGLRQQGVDLNSPSTLRTIGDQGANLGMGVGGFSDHFQKTYGGGTKTDPVSGKQIANNPAMAAQAGGITATWGQTQKKNGQYSQALNQMPSFAAPSNSDLGVVMNKLSQEVRKSAGNVPSVSTHQNSTAPKVDFNNPVLNQALSHFANAKVGLQMGDAQYTARKAGIIQQGQANFLQSIESTHGAAARMAANQHIEHLYNERMSKTTRTAA